MYHDIQNTKRRQGRPARPGPGAIQNVDVPCLDLHFWGSPTYDDVDIWIRVALLQVASRSEKAVAPPNFVRIYSEYVHEAMLGRHGTARSRTVRKGCRPDMVFVCMESVLPACIGLHWC